MSHRSSLSKSERDLFSKLRRLVFDSEPLLRGNLVDAKRKCGKKTCGCANDPERRHRALYLGFKLDGKQRMIYIPKEWEETVRLWTTRHSEARELLEEISLKTLERLEKRKE